MNFSETEDNKKFQEAVKAWSDRFPSKPMERWFINGYVIGKDEGFKAGQERHINNKTLADILYRNGFNKALEEVEKNISIWTQLHPAQLGQITKGIEALKKKEVKE